MKISRAMGLQEREIISLVGGGGKTTLMFRLAGELALQKKVIITTTTKIYRPSPDKYPLLLLGRDEQKEKEKKELAGYLQSGLIPVVGSELLQNKKVDGITGGQLNMLAKYADYILVEADGSKGRSLKGHLDFEPVIPALTTVLVVVIGADVLGKTLDDEYVHRSYIVSQRTGRKEGSLIDPEIIADLINHPEELLRDCPSGAKVVAFINKLDCLKNPAEGRRLGGLLLSEKIRKVLLGSAKGVNPVLDVLEYS
ncbi:MAG TPA: selenium cofactor biosynthesis protein YqeC [Bacillota bacterium]|jgi:probable selenium-dependent hydroxylase accessory protein YqeC|nr:selenium cofactor biosynthesis protein YqeC [Peptococcaceae bacterium MAG4]NLW39049.1 putative selenium-dependent hydroxylase accessory protein YqeC [Peptococcaceae bacterium]HPZ43140.1 selenium cofactor biosynthesis protein YqeC [Bacillota bacterium]HQD75878.1 selenium cofactor biosynthesis protein YqeC [Bacillota bacterium]HUM58391.1 selenium cofactor biosynthesis protein YqeC [Bacillota bacterium]